MQNATFKKALQIFERLYSINFILGPFLNTLPHYNKCSRILEIIDINGNIIWISRNFKKTLQDSYFYRSIFRVKMFFFLAGFVEQDSWNKFIISREKEVNILNQTFTAINSWESYEIFGKKQDFINFLMRFDQSRSIAIFLLRYYCL